MSLVGDIIMDLRARMPDAPAVLGPPVLVSVSSTNLPGGQLAPGGTYTIAVTVTTQWGETLPSQPAQVALGASDNVIQIVLQDAPCICTPDNLSARPTSFVNVYEAAASSPLGPTADQWTLPAQPPGAVYTIGLLGTPFTHGALPTRSTAFLPDTDGNFIGAYTAYRLLKRALDAMVKIAGGIIDVTGVQSIVNTSMYRLDSPFYLFVNSWFDGYPMDIVPRSFMYLRNSAAGFSGILSYEQDGPQSVIQVWPQSNRTGGQNVLAAPMGIYDDTFEVVDGTGFLSIGLARVDSEVIGYSVIQDGTTFAGLVRGLGGTDIVPHAAGAVVTELNIRMSGYRMTKTYKVGDSAQTIQVPQAWEEPLVNHMLGQVRSMEQDDQQANQLMQLFTADAEKIAKGSRLGKTKPRQIPIWGQNVSDARNVNGIGFGWLIN